MIKGKTKSTQKGDSCVCDFPFIAMPSMSFVNTLRCSIAQTVRAPLFKYPLRMRTESTYIIPSLFLLVSHILLIKEQSGFCNLFIFYFHPVLYNIFTSLSVFLFTQIGISRVCFISTVVVGFPCLPGPLPMWRCATKRLL
jgi:hypothetical protein